MSEFLSVPHDLSVSHNMSVPAAVERLSLLHGEMKARKFALKEQQKARRARSRKRFHFWGAVAELIERGATH